VAEAAAVPRLMKFGGVVRDTAGAPRVGVVGITFSIYREQEGGGALWMETQNVELDSEGRYTALLGAQTREGLPLDLFTAGEPRWLGVRASGPQEVEQPRVLLVSVPYALKAADADTLGGRPAPARPCFPRSVWSFRVRLDFPARCHLWRFPDSAYLWGVLIINIVQ
jgi:hypothetical protein